MTVADIHKAVHLSQTGKGKSKEPSVTLCKEHFVRKIATFSGYSKQESNQVLESLLEFIKSTLESGENIMISGFDKIQVKDKKPRRARNPGTRNCLPSDANRVVTFKSSDVLREEINE